VLRQWEEWTENTEYQSTEGDVYGQNGMSEWNLVKWSDIIPLCSSAIPFYGQNGMSEWNIVKWTLFHYVLPPFRSMDRMECRNGI